MSDSNDLIRNILSDMRVELAEIFDRNFERKGFFGSKWKPRKDKKVKGSLLHVTGKMRRSIRAAIRGRGVHFSSPLPYTELHNKGGKFTQTVRTHNRTNKRTGKTHTVRSHFPGDEHAATSIYRRPPRGAAGSKADRAREYNRLFR